MAAGMYLRQNIISIKISNSDFRPLITASFLVFYLNCFSQDQYELNTGWVCTPAKNTSQDGVEISRSNFSLSGWLPATVPGTVLTTLLNNKLVPDPFYGMNNKKIRDIYETGKEQYTYWFVKKFTEKFPKNDGQVWLNFRGINYSCDVFLNGHKLNEKPHKGMFLRVTYNITQYIAKDGNNRLAVIVYPPDPPGNPNGGQGGDGEIARNVGHQYVAGWDWIQPVRDRNTGIWDKVTIQKTTAVNLQNPHVITLVPGVRFPGEREQPVIIRASAELQNATGKIIRGTLQYRLDGILVKEQVILAPFKMTKVSLPDLTFHNPKLWWPSGYGSQYLYKLRFEFVGNDGVPMDNEDVQTGIREIQTSWNTHTKSREIAVNGQKIFIKGGNWIISDAMLRFSPERYDAGIRFHRDMNLNLIRIWGGALTERPEFYNACDKYGLLVFQDFWFSGDCNGRWPDPIKKEDQSARRLYPDDHSLALASITDQVKMIRNHPSLAFYCGGNEITPPEDILQPLKDSLLPQLDGTRYLFDYSNTDSMSHNSLGGNGDGPYGIQNINNFWSERTFPFNSEVGSVGTGDYESLERFIPREDLVQPEFAGGQDKVDSVWAYHKYIGYDHYIDLYGKPKDARDFGMKAQLLNYEQYRGLIEGFTAHMWDWYTGVIIWKTQNPWTALRGQMYDCYLDPNACLYGLHHGGEPVHAMYNPVTGTPMVVNNSFKNKLDLLLEIKAYDMKGREQPLSKFFVEAGASTVRSYPSIKGTVQKLSKIKGTFLSLRLLDIYQKPVSENLYWLPDSSGNYAGLQKIKTANIAVKAVPSGNGKITVTISNPVDGPVAFFNRLSLVNNQTKKRVLPVFYSDNYVSVLPGSEKIITMEYNPINTKVMVSIKGWNIREQLIALVK